MRSYRSLAVAGLILVAASAVDGATVARSAADPVGLWYADGGAARVDVARCGDELCGTVVWLRSPFDVHGCPLTDEHNPDPSLRDREVAGLRILEGFPAEPDSDGLWRGGSVYDPGSGRVYSANFWMDDEDRLSVRGYVGFSLLGRTTTWIRVTERSEVCLRTRSRR